MIDCQSFVKIFNNHLRSLQAQCTLNCILVCTLKCRIAIIEGELIILSIADKKKLEFFEEIYF